MTTLSLTPAQHEWLVCLGDKLPPYLQTLAWPEQPGRFLPCAVGVTQQGRQMALGFSCFALKLYYMLNLWQTLPLSQKSAWVDFVKSFQVDSYPFQGQTYQHAFIDPPVINFLAGKVAWYRRLAKPLFRPNERSYARQVIVAETKQALATLAEIGEVPAQPYCDFPTTQAAVKNYLQQLNWEQPWGAGGQASALVVFLKLELPKKREWAESQELLKICLEAFEALADTHTGSYFRGPTPARGQLINGAMKVLTALNWLEAPIHYPEPLIDTCLADLPPAEGCHLVDSVYVLYRCLQQTQYRRLEIQTYCLQMLDLIRQHHQPDGGFSYYLDRSQTTYYRVPITQGLAASDIHGTCLLTWAVAMILKILDDDRLQWRVIKP